jgi:hypothetical protein
MWPGVFIESLRDCLLEIIQILLLDRNFRIVGQVPCENDLIPMYVREEPINNFTFN